MSPSIPPCGLPSGSLPALHHLSSTGLITGAARPHPVPPLQWGAAEWQAGSPAVPLLGVGVSSSMLGARLVFPGLPGLFSRKQGLEPLLPPPGPVRPHLECFRRHKDGSRDGWWGTLGTVRGRLFHPARLQTQVLRELPQHPLTVPSEHARRPLCPGSRAQLGSALPSIPM